MMFGNRSIIFIFALLNLFGALLASVDHTEKKELEVTISVDYNPPSTFHRSSTDDYRAASAVTLSCDVNGLNEGLLYEWSSTCTGACFVRGGTTRSVSTHFLRSYDSGVHTCVVYDGVGCSGNASITMNVVGAGIYVHSGHQVLANNSIILAGVDDRIGEFRCVSGSKRGNVGYFFNTAGRETTFSNSDPFLVTRGAAHSPGMLHVRSLSPLPQDEQGVYTCRIPDENENMVSVHVGLYLSNSAESPTIDSLESDLEGQKITCTSSQSPATDVIWLWNGRTITPHNNTNYKFTKTLVDRRNAVYWNILTVEGTFEGAVGEYSCTVKNSIGNDTASTTIKALEISGHEIPIIVGLGGTIACTTKLNVSKMEWFLVGVDDPVENNVRSSSLLLPLDPKTTGLNGAMFTCKATTVTGHEYEETVTIEVKELDHTVGIEGQESPLLAGETHTLTCVVVTDITPTVKWMGADGNPVTEGDGIVLGDAIVEGNTTRITMTFSLRTSHGGSYSCLSVVDHPSSIRRSNWGIIVKIPPPTVRVIRTPNDTQLFTTSQLELTCLTEVDPAVDTDVTVTNSWRGPSGTISSDSRITVGIVMKSEDMEYQSSVNFNSLKSSDTGTYNCFSTVQPSVTSPYIVGSGTVSTSTSVSAALKVTIQVSYTAPDQYPDYEPPNYRAASSVTLRCVTEGASGSVSYRWSSTCSSCFASSSTSSTISESILRSRDRGVHTCTATDSSGNSGSNFTQMNIVGAGIYVNTYYSYGGLSAAQPNNSFVRIRQTNSNPKVGLYCCSNSTQNRGSITFSTGSTYSYDTNYFDIEHYNRGSGNGGCAYFSIHYTGSTSSCYRYDYSCRNRVSYVYLSNDGYSGIFTCNIPDASGIMQRVNFGLYDSSFSSQPSVTQLAHVTSQDQSLTLTCTSRNSPPTSIFWYKNGQALKVDWNTIKMRQSITNRRSSYYESTLLIQMDPDDLLGDYTCKAQNSFGSSISTAVSMAGMQFTDVEDLIVSRIATFDCSSDMDVIQIQWFKDGQLVHSTNDDESEFTLDLISTDDHGSNLTCRVSSPYGDQERSVVLEVEVPDEWASIEITSSNAENPLHQTDYALICTVTAIDGMRLAPTIEWFYPNGSLIVSTGNISVSESLTEGTITTSTLSFGPVLSELGGIYTCKATVNVPWMTVQPPSHTTSNDMVVTTQAMFQLRMEPVQYCAEWSLEKALALEEWVKLNIERAVRQHCDCDFQSSAIHSGEFGCRTSKTSVLYRAIINGTSDLRTADELMDFIEDWRTNEGTLLYNKFRLDLSSQNDCRLRIESFNEDECSPLPSSSNDAHVPLTNGIKDPSFPSPDSCYTIRECGGEKDEGSGIKPLML